MNVCDLIILYREAPGDSDFEVRAKDGVQRGRSSTEVGRLIVFVVESLVALLCATSCTPIPPALAARWIRATS